MRHLSRLIRLFLVLSLAAPTLAQAAPIDPADGIDGVEAAARRPHRATRTTPRSTDTSITATDSGLAPLLTWGVSLPVSRFGFTRNEDGSYGGGVTPIQPGVGVSLYWNLVRGSNGTAPVALATTLFGATDVSSKQSDAGLGLAVGPSFFNNTFGIQLGVDLYRRIGDKDTGALMASAGGQNGFSRENVFVLFNFGIGLGKSAPGALKIAP